MSRAASWSDHGLATATGLCHHRRAHTIMPRMINPRLTDAFRLLSGAELGSVDSSRPLA
jgi:hypothetical protein